MVFCGSFPGLTAAGFRGLVERNVAAAGQLDQAMADAAGRIQARHRGRAGRRRARRSRETARPPPADRSPAVVSHGSPVSGPPPQSCCLPTSVCCHPTSVTLPSDLSMLSSNISQVAFQYYVEPPGFRPAPCFPVSCCSPRDICCPQGHHDVPMSHPGLFCHTVRPATAEFRPHSALDSPPASVARMELPSLLSSAPGSR